jgi:hypothetical protein
MRSDAIVNSRRKDLRIRRRCVSPKTMMWCKRSRRIDSVSRSATPFCQSEPGAVGLSRMRDDGTIDPVAIADEVVRSLVP